MSATTTALFGARTASEPATRGSYGEAPLGFRLPEETRLGVVRLQVSDLARSIAFYEDVLGLRELERGASRTVFASQGDDRPLVELFERRGTRPVPRRGRLGLYHFAILLPDRPSLGRFVRHLGEIGARAGAGDHLVSEAFYLEDPDGLGIEVYADRPREAWQRTGRELMISTDPVDVTGLVRAAGDEAWRGAPTGTTIGHVHLHVADLSRASDFFSEALGFDRMTWRYPGALFLGAGGYHHHLGTNTWAGAGAVPPTAEEARLLEWTIELPDAASVSEVARSLAAAGYPAERDVDGSGIPSDLVTRDPWETQIRLRVVAAAPSGVER